MIDHIFQNGLNIFADVCLFGIEHSFAYWILLLIIHVISVICLLFFHARLFIDACGSPTGKGLTSWLSFVMSNCKFATFPLIS